MRVHHFDDPGAWLLAAAPHLMAREALHAEPIARALVQARAGKDTRAALVTTGGQVELAALVDAGTLHLSIGPTAAVTLANTGDTWDDVDAVTGPAHSVLAFTAAHAGAWTFGPTFRCRAGHTRIDRLDVPGERRLAREEDLSLLVPWLWAYARHVLPRSPEEGDVMRAALTHVRHAELHVWTSGGALLACALVGPTTPRGVGMTALCTPRSLWRRPYWQALAVDLHDHLLDLGHAFTTFNARVGGLVDRAAAPWDGLAFTDEGPVVTARRADRRTPQDRSGSRSSA
ncbi:hypothetical protein [Deinococcus pimensis]|uniref:hypothetical protein n=1 Tax=Deinococcus pimensis TaxID=309888 RepID=UPI0004805170|nr:hypothetical protein [Deinococcus pimensis]